MAASFFDNSKKAGVNLAGLDFSPGTLPGRLFFDYFTPTLADMQYWANRGFTIFRIPFLWERIQPVLFSTLEPVYLGYIQTMVTNAQAMGMVVILDVHNFGSYSGNAIGTSQVPATAFTDLWNRIYQAFSAQAATVAFGLMNEPANMTIAAWAKVAQSVVTNLRAQGSQHVILASGGNYCGAHSWFQNLDSSNVANSVAFANFTDPLYRTWLEIHEYTDSDFSGTHTACTAPEATHYAYMTACSAWAATNNQKLFLGEFGVAQNAQCYLDMKALLEGIDDPAWMGFTYWFTAAQSADPFDIYPVSGVDQPQMAMLQAYTQYFANQLPTMRVQP
jgi:endoglucanase